MRWLRQMLLVARVAALRKSISIMEQRVDIAVSAGWVNEIPRRRFEINETLSRISALEAELTAI